MSAIAAALERGREAVETDRAKAKFEPVDVEHRGWLVARIKDLRSGEVEGVYYAQGCWQFYAVSRRANGDAYCADVRDSQLKRCAKAMIGTGGPTARGEDWRGELIEEAAAIARDRTAAALADSGAGEAVRKRGGR